MPVFIPRSVKMEKEVQEIQKQVKEILARADSNGDGCITKDELEKAVKELGSRWPCFRACRFLQIADLNHDGQICGQAERDQLVAAILDWYADKH